MTTRIALVRQGYFPWGTYGTVFVGDWTCLSVERPWLNNRPSVSCIPCGTYPLMLDRYHQGGYEAYEITTVPDRARILVHIANVPTDVEGCVGLGNGPGWIKDQWGATESATTFKEFMRRMAALTDAAGSVPQIAVMNDMSGGKIL